MRRFVIGLRRAGGARRPSRRHRCRGSSARQLHDQPLQPCRRRGRRGEGPPGRRHGRDPDGHRAPAHGRRRRRHGQHRRGRRLPRRSDPALVDGLEMVVNGARLDLQPSAPARLSQPGRPDFRPSASSSTSSRPCRARRRPAPPSRGRSADTAHADRVGWREIVVAAGTRSPADRVIGRRRDRQRRAFARIRERARRPDGRARGIVPCRDRGWGSRDRCERRGWRQSGLGERRSPGRPLAGASDAFAALVAIVVSVALGAAHAASPGHGNTLMTAYLVGTRGTPRRRCPWPHRRGDPYRRRLRARRDRAGCVGGVRARARG